MNLRESPLAETLRDIQAAGQTGVLSVQRESIRKEIFFARGGIVYASSNAEEDRLERVFLKWGLLDKDQLARATETCRAEGIKIREVLVRWGILTEESMSDFMSAVMSERIYSLFLWPEAEVEWHPLPEDQVQGETQLRISAPNLVLEGVRRMAGFETIHSTLLEVNPTLRLAGDPPVTLQDLRLHPSEGYVFSLFSSGADVKAVVSLAPLSEDETCRLIYGFLILGLLRPIEVSESQRTSGFSIRAFAEHEGRAAERVEEIKRKIRGVYKRIGELQDHEILGVAPDASLEAIQEAFRRVNDKYRLERFSPAVRKESRTELEIIAARIAEAYLNLQERAMGTMRGQRAKSGGGSQVRMRRSKQEIEAARREADEFARACLKRADDAERLRDYHTAINFVQQALHRCPEVAAYHARLAQLLEKNPRWQKRAEDEWLRAIELDKDNSGFKLALGRIYNRYGMQSKALKLFEEGLEKDPTNTDLQTEIAALKGPK